ncbi:hypothetical protein ACO22_04391 [Paracoccidioides brasiliensis]|uniref:CCHC-type domain-containing protein n=1 Tax=Paracoccidioides brasiliensis TaxID=121759 RepID=A0A1D2JD65_PARBR|nr:hypothetical protein ACO22_04391 [Paracoccidioides brasiliensis]
MDSHPMPGDAVQPFHPQPVQSVVSHKQRGQKHPRKGKQRQNHPSAGSNNGPPKHTQPQSCYNCGSLEHWAQQCPEPRREFPTGGMKPGRPPKRQKTTVSYHAHYQGDPFYDKSHPGPQRSYTHPPVAHPTYQPRPMAASTYGSPTPMSAHPYSAGPWPHEPLPPQYNSPQSYGLPTSTSAYNPQFSSASTAMPPHRGYFHPQYASQYAEPEYHRKSFDRHQQMPPHVGNNRQSRKKWRRSDNVPAIALPVEPWMEELQSLDIPESNSGQNEIVWRPAVQVARPLPSTFDERDDIGMLPPFTTLPPGMSVSKYILDKGPEEFVDNIRNTEDWPFVMADPIFLEISTECELVSIDELISRRKLIFETHRIEPPPPVEEADGGLEQDDEIYEENHSQENYGSVVSSNEAGDDRAMSGGYSSEYSHTPLCSPKAGYRDDMSSTGSYQADDRGSFRESASPDAPEDPVSPDLRTNYEYHEFQDRQDSKQHYSKPGKNSTSDKRRNQRIQRDRRQQMDSSTRKSGQLDGRRNAPFDCRGGRSGYFNPQDRRKQKQQQFKGSAKTKAKKVPNNRGRPPYNAISEGHLHENHDNRCGLDGNTGRSHNEDSSQPKRSHGYADIQQSDHHHPHDQVDFEHNSRKRSRQDESLSAPEEPMRQEDDITPRIRRRQPHVAEAYRYDLHQPNILAIY